MSRPLRVVRWIVLTPVVLLLVCFALIKLNMLVARIRVGQLLSDFHSIRLNQSNWSDAQRLMTRWHRWGHAEGICSKTDCTYDIIYLDPLSGYADHHQGFVASGLYRTAVSSPLEHFGWRPAGFDLRLTVQDGVIVRNVTRLQLAVLSEKWFPAFDEDHGYDLLLYARAHNRLTVPAGMRDFGWIAGPPGTPNDHPDYKEGEPSGCENCISKRLTYTPTLDHATLVWLTSYDLSCFTRFHSCRYPKEILPAATLWRDEEPSLTRVMEPPHAPEWCTAPARALARDAGLVFVADVLKVMQAKSDPQRTRWRPFSAFAQIRILRTLKGSAPVNAKHITRFAAYEPREFPFDVIPLQPKEGERILVFLPDLGVENQMFSEQDVPCSFLLYSDVALADAQRGIAEDVLSRHGDSW